MSVRVVARIRPLLASELDKDVIVRVDSTEDGRTPGIVKIPSPKNEAEEFSFAFNGVYDQSTSQEDLFNAEVAPHIKALFQGVDLTLFAYGVTGTGKTYTMRGGMKLADRGMIPRLLSHVFRRGKKIAKDSDGATEVAVALSYYEIYNDKVYDLLEPPETRTPAGLPLREKDGKTCVVGLSEQACADLRDFERLYIAANQNRVTAATKLNAHSSRSHAILRVKVTQTTRAADGSGSVVAVRESIASAIDLAGSEDNRRTDNGRERLVESAAINKSLFVLSQCVDAIARGEKRIPYRESKMTRILSLGQNCGITVMILNLAPVRSYHLDTLSSLNVSSRAKRIEVREIENEVVYKHQPPRSLASTASSSAASSTTSLSTAASGASAASSLSSISASSARQPLRALTSNTHNMHTGLAAAKAAADKPVKAFHVYADRSGGAPKPAGSSTSGSTATPPTASHAPASVSAAAAPTRMGPLANLAAQARATAAHLTSGSKTSGGSRSGKQPADAGTAEPRPSKLARPSIHLHSAASLGRPSLAPAAAVAAAVAAVPSSLSAEQIEAIVERKVAEALAARAQPEQEREREKALEQQQQEQQRRLEALERRIEDSTRADDPRAEGLRCLLLARQHKEVGDDAVALRYYEQALPFFPGQARLVGKIEKLKAKMMAAEATVAAAAATAPLGGGSPRKSPRSSQKRKRAAAAAAAARAAVQTPTTPTFPRVRGLASGDGDDVATAVGADEVNSDDAADGEEADVEDGAAKTGHCATTATATTTTPQRRRHHAGSWRHHGSSRKAAKTSRSEGPRRSDRDLDAGSGSGSGSGNEADDADDESMGRAAAMAMASPSPRRTKQALAPVSGRRRARGLLGAAGAAAEDHGMDGHADESMSPAVAAAEAVHAAWGADPSAAGLVAASM